METWTRIFTMDSSLDRASSDQSQETTHVAFVDDGSGGRRIRSARASSSPIQQLTGQVSSQDNQCQLAGRALCMPPPEVGT